jgi:hypothetical protein
LFSKLRSKDKILVLNCKGFSLKIWGLILNHFSTASKGVFTLSSRLRLPCLRYRFNDLTDILSGGSVYAGKVIIKPIGTIGQKLLIKLKQKDSHI